MRWSWIKGDSIWLNLLVTDIGLILLKDLRGKKSAWQLLFQKSTLLQNIKIHINRYFHLEFWQTMYTFLLRDFFFKFSFITSKLHVVYWRKTWKISILKVKSAKLWIFLILGFLHFSTKCQICIGEIFTVLQPLFYD